MGTPSGFDLFRRDYNSFNFIGTNRNTTYSQVSTGGQIVLDSAPGLGSRFVLVLPG